MICRRFFDVDRSKRCIDLSNIAACALRLHQLHHTYVDPGEHFSVVTCTVVIELAKPKMLCNDIELMLFQLRKQGTRQHDRINRGKIVFHAAAPGALPQKACIKRRVMRDQHRAAAPAERIKLAQRLPFERRAAHIVVGDAGQFCNLRRDRTLRVYKCVEAVDDFAAAQFHRADLRDAFSRSGKAGRLQVKYNHLAVKPAVRITADSLHHVVDEIGFDAVDHFDIAAALADFGNGVHAVRKCLHHTVVGDRDRLVPKFVGALDQLGRGCYAVHRRHV